LYNNLTFALYEYETWSLTVREEQELWVSENRVLRRIFGPKRGEVAGNWKRLHNGKLCNLYTSQNVIRLIKSRRMRWAGHVARMGEIRNAHNILVGKPRRKRPLGRRRRRLEDNTGKYLRVIWLEGMDWIHLAQERDHLRALLNTVMNFRVP
jgi:hypothetical protein